MRISTKDPLDILIDPDAKEYDPKTWNEVFETKWMSLDQVEEQYGQEVADKLRVAAEYGSTWGKTLLNMKKHVTVIRILV